MNKDIPCPQIIIIISFIIFSPAIIFKVMTGISSPAIIYSLFTAQFLIITICMKKQKTSR